MRIGKVNMKTICLRMRFPEVKPKMGICKKCDFYGNPFGKQPKSSKSRTVGSKPTKGVILGEILKMV